MHARHKNTVSFLKIMEANLLLVWRNRDKIFSAPSVFILGNLQTAK